MATFPIRIFGDPVLKQRARDVAELDGALAELVDTMYDTMYEANGLGLAAPQVGVQKRLFTFDTHDDDGPHVIVNPVVVDTHGEWTFEEGCLSVPGYHFEIVRPKVVTIQGIDLDGKEVVFEADELPARVFLHEIDHLDGILLLDRLDPDARRQALRAIREHDLVATARDATGSPRL
ncbi:MAG: peptide deformylase [Acidimicrobiia bacterium]